MTGSILNANNYFLNPYAIPYFIVGVMVIWEGVFIILQNKKSLINLAYMLTCIAAGIWLTGVGAIYTSLQQDVSFFWGRFYSFLGIIFVTPAVYFFSVCWRKTLPWPQTTKASAGQAKSVIFNYLTAFIFYLFFANSRLFIEGMWSYPWGFYPKAGKLYVIFILWFYLVMSASIKNFVHVYRKERIPIRKRQSKLLIIAFSIAFLGSVEFLPNYGIALYLSAFVPIFICITIVGYSVIRYKLMDIETVIHKTIAWFLANLVLLTPFVFLIYFTRGWHANLGKTGTFGLLSLFSLLFLFFVRAFQPRVDHFFQRRRYRLEETAGRFTKDVVHLRDFNNLIELIEKTIKDTLYSQRIDIFIYNDSKKAYELVNRGNDPGQILSLSREDAFLRWLTKNDKIVHKDFIDIDHPEYTDVLGRAKDYFNMSRTIVAIPLVLNNKLLGIINLFKKANLKRYTALDFHFLTIFKNQSAIAISNSLLYENMEERVRQRSRELVDVQKQLIQAEKLATVGTLAGGVAHEINNPLTAILTNVQMLLESNPIDGELDRQSLQLIEEATKRCRTIVQKLMAYAKRPLESSQVGKVDLLNVLKNVLAFLGYQLKQENIKIRIQAEPANYLAVGSHNELEQAITNLVLNAKDAIKKVKRSGVIHISFSRNAECIEIKVEDEGSGIPENVISKIFDPFFTTKEVGSGLGLGLSICQAIVEKHNGIISVQSQANKGSAFIVQLPAAK